MIKEINFSVKRLSIHEAESLRSSWLKPQKTIQRSYKITNDEQRYQFLYKVINKEMSVTEAASQYGMNYTTAKNVLNLYLAEGRISKKKFRTRGKMNNKITQSKESKTDSQQNLNSEENSLKNKNCYKDKLINDFWAQHITNHFN